MRPTTLLARLCLFAPPVFAQAVWSRQVPAAGNELAEVEMLNALEGWAVGASGELLHTTTGGIQWTTHSAGLADLAAVDFAGTTGFVAGTGIHRSTDNGQTWSLVQPGSNVVDVHALDAQTVWAVTSAGNVLRSTNGGNSFSAATLVTTTNAARGIAFADGSVGLVCGNGGLLERSTDGGASWSPIDLSTTDDLHEVELRSSGRAVVMSSTTLYSSDDAGATWTSSALPVGSAALRMSWLSASHGFFLGASGTVWRTTDHGTSWSALGSLPSGVNDLDFGDLANGLAVGTDSRAWSSTDGGANWTLVHGGSTNQGWIVYDVSAIDSDRAWASCSQGVILRTNDGGLTWTPNPTDSQTLWHGVDFADPLHGYAVGRKQGFYPMKAWTNDGGSTWNVQEGLGMYDFNDVDAVTASTVVACADTYIHRSTNSGLAWSLVSTTPQSSYKGGDFIDAQTGWVVGGHVFKTADAGASWTLLATPLETLEDVSFVNEFDGWAVGANGLVVSSNDGGATWASHDAGAGTSLLTAVEALTADVVWVVGSGGFVARTTDAGASWTELAPAVAPGTLFFTAEFLGEDDGWIGSGFENGLWRRSAGPEGGCSAFSYCVATTNSIGLEAHLFAQGQPSATFGAFGVRVQDAVPNQAGILIASPFGAASLSAPAGILCIQPPFERLGTHILDPAGRTTYAIPVTPELVGTSRWFQFWYRDPLHPAGTGSAFSDGLEVTFCQ